LNYNMNLLTLKGVASSIATKELSLRVKRSNLAFPREIAAHLAGARNKPLGNGSRFLNPDLGSKAYPRVPSRLI
jgi:hypothetical protein